MSKRRKREELEKIAEKVTKEKREGERVEILFPDTSKGRAGLLVKKNRGERERL